MDKHQDYMDGKQSAKRPRWLTVCMMATAASVIVLAGCGDDEPATPAEEPSPLEQDVTDDPETGMTEEPAMQQDSNSEVESATEGSITQGNGSEAEEPPMSNQGMSDEDMPEDTMDEPVEDNVNTGEEDEAGFGEGTEPMPGADDDENSSSNQ